MAKDEPHDYFQLLGGLALVWLLFEGTKSPIAALGATLIIGPGLLVMLHKPALASLPTALSTENR